MSETPELFAPPDMVTAYADLGAMCGHGALAAALGIPVKQAFPYFEQRGWVNIPMMKAAIEKAGKFWLRTFAQPGLGTAVVMVQWLGRWMEPGVPIGARCAHRHWIALREGNVWDSLRCRDGWLTRTEWERGIEATYPPRVTGHQIDAVLQIFERR